MKIEKKKMLLVFMGAAVAVGLVVFVVVGRSAPASRYHDSWMPDDVDWTVYVGDSVPSNGRGFEDDYFVIRNTWETYRKHNDSWGYVGKIIELEGVTDYNIKWVNQLYSLYQKNVPWYKGNTNEWAYDLRDGYLFETKEYNVHFFGEKNDDVESIIDYGVQKARRRESIVFNGQMPVKPFDDSYFYSFNSWDHSLESVTESFDTYATFTSYENGSLVKKGDDGNYSIGFDEDDEIKQQITSIEIPDSINGQPVTKIDDAAFSECSNLEYIKLPESIEYIGDHAFFACQSLKTITIPKNVNQISSTAFSSSLLSLESIVVEEGNGYYKDIDGVLYTIDEKTIIRFPPAKEVDLEEENVDETTITKYTIDQNVDTISSFCFADFYGVNVFVLPENLSTIGTWAFKNTDIINLDIPDQCHILSGNFISGCLQLQNINTSNNNYYSSIDGVLYSKDKKEIFRVPEGKDVSEGFTIPSFVSSLGAYSLSGIAIEEFDIPSTIETINSYALSYLEKLRYIYIPDTVNTIASRAFYSCNSLVIDVKLTKEEVKLIWDSDWAYDREEATDPNDKGFVKKINYGVIK